MRTTRTFNRRVVALALALAAGVLTVPLLVSPASAKPATPVPVCAGAKDLVVDVTRDVRNDWLFPARDGRMWAKFDYTQHVRIWNVGGHQHCVRVDLEGTWVSLAGASPGLTGTISDGVTGTFTGTDYYMWTGRFAPAAPTSGYLGQLDAGCTPDGVCANDVSLVVKYFSQGYQHCVAVRGNFDVDGGEHGHISLIIDGGINKVSGGGDITG